MELKDYWRAVRRRWALILLGLLVFPGAAAFLNWTTTPLYESSVQLFVATTQSDTSDAYQGGLLATQRVASYADLVNTRQLAETVADNLGDGSDPSELRDSIGTQLVPATVSLRVTATDPDAFRARDIAQAYGEALSDLVAELETPSGKSDALVTASIVDDAVANATPVSPRTMRNLSLALVLGLFAGIGLAVLRERLDTSISSSEDIGMITGSPVLGHINSDGVAADQAPGVVLRSATPWAEAFRVLRTNMQFVEVDTEQRVFVVSSALPGEGKSTVVANLAVTLALAGQRVALVDADLRRPKIARRLGLDQSVGLTSVLIGRVGLADAMQQYGDTPLHVMSSGPRPPNPSELLQSRAMSDLLNELRHSYDIVLFDTPPLLPVTDAALLSAEADGLLAVVRHGKTSRDQLRHSLERVEQVGAKCVGVVINLAPTRKGIRGYVYGYGYGYGYQYGYAAEETKSQKQPKSKSKSKSAKGTRSQDAKASGRSRRPRTTSPRIEREPEQRSVSQPPTEQ